MPTTKNSCPFGTRQRSCVPDTQLITPCSPTKETPSHHVAPRSTTNLLKGGQVGEHDRHYLSCSLPAASPLARCSRTRFSGNTFTRHPPADSFGGPGQTLLQASNEEVPIEIDGGNETGNDERKRLLVASAHGGRKRRTRRPTSRPRTYPRDGFPNATSDMWWSPSLIRGCQWQATRPERKCR